jgi:hypothetical protein
VGYFYGVNLDYFTFFSLTEHILFAIEALPVVPIVVLIIFLFDAVLSLRMRKSAATSNVMLADVVAPGMRWSIGTLLFESLGAGYFWYSGSYRLFAFTLIILLTTIMMALATTRRSSIVSMVVIGAGAAILFGEFLGSRYVNIVPALDIITFKSADRVSANVIRAGERGVLYALPDDRRIEFRQWEEIKSVSRQRTVSLFSGKVN